MVLTTLSYMYTVYSHRILRTDTQFSIQTSAHTHTHPSGGPSSVCANKLSFSSPRLAFSPPVSLSLKWSQESTPPQCTALRERERERKGLRERKRESWRRHEHCTPLYSATHKKMSFWLDTKEPFYPPPLSSIFLLSAFRCFVFSFFSLTNLFLFLPL